MAKTSGEYEIHIGLPDGPAATDIPVAYARELRWKEVLESRSGNAEIDGKDHGVDGTLAHIGTAHLSARIHRRSWLAPRAVM